MEMNLNKFVEGVEQHAKDTIVDAIGELLESKYNSYIRFKDGVKVGDEIYILSMSKYRNDVVVALIIGENPSAIQLKCSSMEIIENITSVLSDSKNFKPYYTWIAESDDGAYQEYNEGVFFESEEDAYNDMRDAALKKMKWNTEYDEDLSELLYKDDYIGYEVKFYKTKIVHKSYSGTYTYSIKRIG